MKTIKQQNMDLDLRRFGHNLYTEALSSGNNGGSGNDGDGVDINTILDNISIKDDLLTKLQAIDYTNQGEDGVLTDLTFDDVFNDYNDFIKSCLYRKEIPAIGTIAFPQRISVMKGPDSLSFEMLGGGYIYYEVYIVDEDNDIKIYVIKQSSQPG